MMNQSFFFGVYEESIHLFLVMICLLRVGFVPWFILFKPYFFKESGCWLVGLLESSCKSPGWRPNEVLGDHCLVATGRRWWDLVV